MSIQGQIARSLRDVSDRAVRVIPGAQIVLGTDVGIVREENQDRVAAVRFKKSPSAYPFSIVILSDGMGGMVDGANCAALAIAGFIASLVEEPESGDPIETVRRAAESANRLVFDRYSGRGGATLSALLWNRHGGIWTVNVGDSRIYHLPYSEGVKRLTTDDTMKDAFGGEGKDLIQFIGMGRGLQPHISTVPYAGGSIILTSDGTHFIDENVFYALLENASGAKAKVERAIALARWLSGPDNASIAVVDFEKSVAEPANLEAGQVELWGCGVEAVNIWLPTTPQREFHHERSGVEPKAKSTGRRKPTSRKTKKENAPEQLKIEIDIGGGENDADR